MRRLRIEIPATDRVEAKRIAADYQRGRPHRGLEEEVEQSAWDRGRTPLSRPTFIGLTNGDQPLYKFDIEVESVV